MRPERSRRCLRPVGAKKAVAAPQCQTCNRATCLALYHSAAQLGSLWEHEFLAPRALPALGGRPPVYTVPYETRWQCDRSLITGVIYGDGSGYEERGADLVRCGLGAGSSLWNAVIPHPQPLHVPSYRARAGAANSGEKPPRLEIDAWEGLGDSLSARKVKAHTTPEAVLAGIMGWQRLGWCSLQTGGFGTTHTAECPSGEVLGQLSRHMHRSLDCAHTTSGH